MPFFGSFGSKKNNVPDGRVIYKKSKEQLKYSIFEVKYGIYQIFGENEVYTQVYTIYKVLRDVMLV